MRRIFMTSVALAGLSLASVFAPSTSYSCCTSMSVEVTAGSWNCSPPNCDCVTINMTHSTFLNCTGIDGTVSTPATVFLGSGTCCHFCAEIYAVLECPPNFYYEEFPPIGTRVSVENRQQSYNFLGHPTYGCDSYDGMSEYLICGEDECPCDDGDPEEEPDDDDPGDEPCQECTPLVLDLDHKGFRFTDVEHGVEFDIDADGVMESIAWTGAESRDAFLALDRNLNGVVDDGGELFGGATLQPESSEPNGFEALAVFDWPENGGNGDGIISSSDAVFSDLWLWVDWSHDGYSDASEMIRLSESDVLWIDLDYRESRRRDRHGNDLMYISRYFDQESTPRWVTDVFFLSGEN